MNKAAIVLVLCAVGAHAAQIPLSSTVQTSITVPYDTSLRPSQPFLDLAAVLMTGTSSNPNTPTQIHLTMFSPTGMTFQWATGNYKTGTGYLAPSDPTSVATIAQYGTSASNLNNTATGTAQVYSYFFNTTYAFQGPNTKNYTSPILHSAVAQGLRPGTQYFYRVGDGTTFSPVLNFTLAPSGPTYPQRVILVADWGISNNATSTLQHIMQSVANVSGNAVSYYIGDFSYADTWWSNGTVLDPNIAYEGEPNDGTWQPVWDAWQDFVQPFTSAVPVMGALGNHEEEQQEDGSVFKAVNARWTWPLAQSYSNDIQYYSINTGPVHAIFMSPYSDYTEGSAQKQWLINDLAQVDRSRTPWVIVNMHHPWVCSTGSYKEHEHMRTQLEPITYAGGVDIFFYGHEHSYERSNPVYNYNLDPCGAVHIVIGDAGNAEGLSGLNNAKTDHVYEDYNGGCPNVTTPYPAYMVPLRREEWRWAYYKRIYTFNGDGNSTGVGNPPGYCYKSQPPWSAYRESSFGHGTLDIMNATHALWSWHRNQDSNAMAMDTIYIVRNTTCPNRQSLRAASA